MTQRLACIVLLLALAACSDKSQPQTGSQTHFLETCDASCPDPYECICGACTLQCRSDGPCKDHVENAHCSVAISTSSGVDCNTDALVCDVACQRNSDCNPLGAGYTCDAGRCRAAPRTSGISGVSEETTPPPAICDGSDDIRLGIWNTLGSLTTPDAQFMSPIAVGFAFIDGHCHFYASSYAFTGVVIGSIDDADARQLAIEIRLASFPKFQAYNYAGCADGGSSAISDGVHVFACACGECGDDAPAGLTDAMSAGQTWIQQLAAQGTPWSGPVRAVATDSTLVTHVEMPQTWPLKRAIGDIVVRYQDITPDAGTIFDAAADAAALRRLRMNLATVFPPTEEIYVTDGSKNYALFVRDELPQETSASLHAFETKSWKVIEDAANRAAEKELAARDAGNP